MSYKTIGIVTGANKGIGLAIVRQLALQYPSSPLNNGSFLIYLTARDQGRGEAAVKSLGQDAQLKQAKALQADGGLTEIRFRALDITDGESVQSFVAHLRRAHGEGVDFIINNAGIAMKGFDANVVNTTLNCNYYATLQICHASLPLLKPTARIVNLASMSGHLTQYSPAVRARFLAARSEDDITTLMQEFAAAAAAGREKDAGFPSAAYAVSKAGLIGATRALAAAQKQRGSAVLVNSCCPGYVVTDMTGGKGSKTPDQGAMTPVLLAIRDIQARTGEFWQHEEAIEW